jgi:hypothetical protein
MPRLATCHVCRVIERMPDVHPKTPLVPAILEYQDGLRLVLPDEDGLPRMVPAFDPMLEAFVVKHEHGLPDQAVTHGQQIEVMAVDQNTWDTMDVVTKIKDELHRVHGEQYDESNEYKDAALKCYNAHGNPDLSSGCPDYMDDSKMIGQATYKGDDGETISIPPPFRQYLCFLCPFQQTYIQVELRRRKGMYKDGLTPKQVATAKRQDKHRRSRRFL